MTYTSWPTVVSEDEHKLVTLCRGSQYILSSTGDTHSTKTLILQKDGENIADIVIEHGTVCDFTVSHDLIAIATKNPAGLILMRNVLGSQVIYTRLPLESLTDNSVESITLGTYGANVMVLWHGPDMGPVYTGIVSGRDAFRFDYKPLMFYDNWGRQRIFIRQAYERILAIPHMPKQFGVVAIISPSGIRFYSMKPYYQLNKFTDDLLDMPVFYNTGTADPYSMGVPSRIHFDCWDMVVQLNHNHLTMKYDPLNQASITPFNDWVSLTLDGNPVTSTDRLYLHPFEQDRVLTVTANQDLTSVALHADLPIIIKKNEDTTLSSIDLGTLMKGQTADITLNPIQCLTPWSMSRFIEKFNLKIRAELWS